MKPEIHSKIMQDALDEMKRDSWYVKLKRWFRVRMWIYTCLTRKYWDKTYEGYIFKRRQKWKNKT